MRKLRFEYRMQIAYSLPGSFCHFALKGIPRDTDRQQLTELTIEVTPETVLSEGRDGFGNRKVYGTIPDIHHRFACCIRGEVAISQILYEEIADPDRTAVFRYPYGCVRPGEGLKGYFAGIALPEGASAYEKSLVLMHQLHEDFAYVPGVTSVATSAEEAWTLGKGVCQDFAHILIALLQMAGIPARYTAGMMLGEGASHAWAEAMCGDRWIGLDPTNDLIVNGDYIKFSHGRDWSDCRINRGVIGGGGSQTQQVWVSVQPADSQD